jgi:transcriptional regulator with XRE-family HTH domain
MPPPRTQGTPPLVARGQRLRAAREMRHLGTNALARLANTANSTICRIEAGQHGSDAMLERLARALAVPVAWLREGDESGLRPAEAATLARVQQAHALLRDAIGDRGLRIGNMLP